MFKNGYIKLYRSLLDWAWYDDINTKTLFLHLLLTVSIESSNWHGYTIIRGSRVTSYPQLSEETKLSIQTIRTALRHLELTGEVTRSKTSKFTIITVNNYDKYQEPTGKLTGYQHDTNSHLTVNQQQYNKIKEDIKKREREDTLTLGLYQNVFLTAKEIEKLKSNHGDNWVTTKIDRLSEYLATTSKQYNNHYAMVNKFCREDKCKTDNDTKQSNPSYNLSDFEKLAIKNTPKGKTK